MDRMVRGSSWSEDRTPKVLLVEDEIMIRLADAESLRDAGISVIEAGSGEEAIAVLSSEMGIDLLVTDITMPTGLDGLAVAAFCRAYCPGVPILLASARLPPAGDARADRMIAKPYAVSELLAAVMELLENSWLKTNDRTAC